jgi:phosphatidylglycerol---prolipoprotein diacylglyceryl transferase
VKPVLFQVPTPFGTFPVSSFGVFLLLAFIAAILVARARTQRLGWDPGEVVDLSLYAIIGGIVGARIGYVLVHLKDFVAVPARVLMIWVDAGLTFHGALIGGAAVAWLYGRRRGWRLAAIADVAAPSLAIGYAIAMVGALLYGLNYGRPAHVPWAVTLFGEPRHPTQLYLGALALANFGILLAVGRGSAHRPGRLFWLFLLMMAVERIVVEVFMDSPRLISGLTLAQVVNIVAAVLAAVMWLTRAETSGSAEAQPGEAPPAHTGEPIAPPDAGGSQGAH